MKRYLCCSTADKISIRGLAGRHTLILIDGKRLTGGVGSGVEIERIDVSNIDRIEIIKGMKNEISLAKKIMKYNYWVYLATLVQDIHFKL